LFDYIKGKLVTKSPTEVVLDCGGVGYKISIPLSTFEKLPAAGRVKVFTYLHQKEDGMSLYGFSSLKERSLFQELLSVKGIGPKIALIILSGSSADDFIQAVLSENLTLLREIKGIGPRTAPRIILELKEKLSRFAPSTRPRALKGKEPLLEDARLALVSLGYSKKIAEKAVDAAFKNMPDDFPVQALIKEALKHT
jgi:Holliday junction DNA helicase RuvA